MRKNIPDMVSMTGSTLRMVLGYRRVGSGIVEGNGKAPGQRQVHVIFSESKINYDLCFVACTEQPKMRILCKELRSRR